MTSSSTRTVLFGILNTRKRSPISVYKIWILRMKYFKYNKILIAAYQNTYSDFRVQNVCF